MRHHRLQFVAVQGFEGAPRHHDQRLLRRTTRRQRIDGRMLQDIHGRHWATGGDGHFLHHIEQLALGRIQPGCGQGPCAQFLGDGGAIGVLPTVART